MTLSEEKRTQHALFECVPGTKTAPILCVPDLFDENTRVGAVFVPGTHLKSAKSVSGTLMKSAFCVLFSSRCVPIFRFKLRKQA